MPQLDKLTFASQIFWLFASFFTLYILSIKWLLPSIGKILKVRKKFLSKLNTTLADSNHENLSLEQIKNNFYVNVIQSTLLYIKFIDKESNYWLNTQCNNLPWKKENQSISKYNYLLSRLNALLKK